MILSTLALSLILFAQQDPGQWLYKDFFHLGNDECPEWTEASLLPDGTAFEIDFNAKENKRELCLQLTQRHVDDNWAIKINGQIIAQLEHTTDPKIVFFPVPANTLKSGQNHLSITTDRIGDDIVVGKIRLLEQSYREKFGVRPIQILVRDAKGNKPLPARITIADADGKLAPLYYPMQTKVPNRPGIAYTDMNGKATLEIGAGTWSIWASRGMEWGVDSATLTIAASAPQPIGLTLKREVDTAGYVASDTHIHTVTASGHGDATTWERVHSLAGEGVELAIATDHNHHMDYRPLQKEIGANPFYTPVIGNEVTTNWGHFNAFPFAENAVIPDHGLNEWMPLVADIRKKGAEVIILNHPRWPNFEGGPFGKKLGGLNRETGQFTVPMSDLGIDGVEIFNSTTAVTSWEEVLLDWFSLLNRGHRFFGVGSSDSHTVGDSVGQGRTYVRGSDRNPARIDIKEMCHSFVSGQTSMSLGIYIEAKINGKAPGKRSLVQAQHKADLSIRVAAASWADVNSITLYANGIAVDSVQIENSESPIDFTWEPEFVLKVDAWLVAVAEGDKPQEPFWQSLVANLGAVTNPIWFSAD
ncbi:MAG: PHP domain-containing protein [Planctomycetes bacterium]|nr:PHP domain-containing protein [Planctomycetota bacterium]MBT4027991.1 PHP domain-containing protein [Planctomycetota bacterium]MBT4561119.1 PHP domain-containing protein [Planctomycetota bacterium]MBT5119144.1 PHP domain-containing protein [Planctomycetota bacterium]MBT7011945.1 PHP domain-containing protein [Planctomycetota bacterium]